MSDLGPAAWRFVPTGAPLIGAPIANPAGDSSDRTLGPGEDARYVGPGRRDPGLQHLLQPRHARVRLGPGRIMDLVLHVVDRIRTDPRARGLDSEPRQASGTIEVPGVRASACRARPRRSGLPRPPSRRPLHARGHLRHDARGDPRSAGLDLQARARAARRQLRGRARLRRRRRSFPAGAGSRSASARRTESPVRIDLIRRATRTPGRAAAGGGTRFVSHGRFELAASAASPRRRLRGPAAHAHPRRPRCHRASPVRPGGRPLPRAAALRAPEACSLLRSFSLSGPAFGGRTRRPLRLSVRTVEPARATLALRRRAARAAAPPARHGAARAGPPGAVAAPPARARPLLALVLTVRTARRARRPVAPRRQGAAPALAATLSGDSQLWGHHEAPCAS